MGQTGSDIQLSPRAREFHPFSYECKSLASFAGYKYYDQATAGAATGTTPAVVLRCNRRRPMIMMDYEDFMRLLP